jgi:hypothetical protein
MEDARAFALRMGTDAEPRVAYLERDVVVDEQTLEQLGGLHPTEVFRYSARCEEERCSHFDGIRCTLASRVRRSLKPVTASLPPCSVRATCRWFTQEGREICLRCPQVLTLNVGSDDDTLRKAAAPPCDRQDPVA